MGNEVSEEDKLKYSKAIESFVAAEQYLKEGHDLLYMMDAVDINLTIQKTDISMMLRKFSNFTKSWDKRNSIVEIARRNNEE